MGLVLVILLSGFSVFADGAETQNIIRPTGVVSKNNYHAEGINNGEITTLKGSIIDAISLDLYLSSGRTLVIEARTRCIEEVDVVGFKSISLQRWNGSKWVNVISPWNDLVNDKLSHNLSYSKKVDGGYYYKVSLYHYAQKGTGIFADKQEEFNETSYLWVD